MPYRNIIPFMYVLAFAFGILSIFAKATHITTPFGWFIASLAAQFFLQFPLSMNFAVQNS